MPTETPDLDTELVALERARAAVSRNLDRLARIEAHGADELADEWIRSMVAGTIEKLQRELVVFGRIDDSDTWRIGLYGVEDGGEQIVVDWRARFAELFYQATFDDPRGLLRRISYVGCIDDLFIENFDQGTITGTSPLLTELSRHRTSTMRSAVATLQSEQDHLVRLPPNSRLVVRGGPGTGKTVVGLHRAAWLVYNHPSLTADQLLVVGPSDRFLRYVSAVLPTLGESAIKQTTFDRLLGPSTDAGSDERWLPLMDRLERSFLRIADVKIGRFLIPESEVSELAERILASPIPWRDRRKSFVNRLARSAPGSTTKQVADAVRTVWPSVSLRQVWRKLRSRRFLVELGADSDLVDAWLAADSDGALYDEVRARFEGVPGRFSHVIIDEAQDISLFQLRAVMRRGAGFTLVGDDAQQSTAYGLGLIRAAEQLEAELVEMRTAYRMSAEIVEWLNAFASIHSIDAVQLDGIRPTGNAVRSGGTLPEEHGRLQAAWPNVAKISAEDVWGHKGIEYDAVLVDATDMTPREIYLAASRAAHELSVVNL